MALAEGCSTPRLQVSRHWTVEYRTDVHGLEDGDEGHVLRLQLSPLHSGTRHFENAFIRLVKSKQGRSPPALHREGPFNFDAEHRFKSIESHSQILL